MHAGTRLAVTLGFTGALVLGWAGAASAHVHGITPLRCVAPHGGAIALEGTPAFLTNGGPIEGLIPRDTGSGNIAFGGGGFDTPACPAP